MEDKAGVKRRKVDAESSTAKPADVKPITSANQLRSLLFSQQAAYDVKQGTSMDRQALTAFMAYLANYHRRCPFVQGLSDVDQ